MHKFRRWYTQRAKPLLAFMSNWRIKTICSVIVGLCILGLSGMLFGPRVIAYDYAKKQTCAASPRLFPSNETHPDLTFKLHYTGGLRVGSWHLYAHTLCATAQHLPKEKTHYTYQQRLIPRLAMGRSVTVTSATYPKINPAATPAPRTIALDLPITIALNRPDATFSYRILGNHRQSHCRQSGQKLVCDIAKLNLQYATSYNLVIERYFKNRPQGTVATMPVQTVSPISIVETSIPPDATVQDKPNQITLVTDKQLSQFASATLTAKGGDKTTSIPVTPKLDGTKVIAVFGQELPRKTTFELTLTGLRATDTSGLVGGSYTIRFTTSGGPRATGVNIGSRNVSLSPTITVSFDQPLSPAQNPAQFVTFLVNGAPFAAAVSIVNNRISIKPASQLPLCAKLSVVITGGLQNPAGVSGDSAWNTASRSLCYTTFSIGSSVKGRPITAYRFGSGPSLIVYMGAMHGSEANSKRTMDEWFQELNAYPDRIPAHRSIVIIPAVNPDGVAVGSRTNANGVDINRNFPANDWKSTVTMPGSSQQTNAGGPSPLSEPESRAIAAFIQQNNPRLVMSFHSKAAVVEANEAGDSVSIAASYAAKSQYRAVPKSQSTPIFQYDTTGAMEDWMRDRLGRPAIVVELSTNTSSEFARNRNALWYTIGL